MVHMTMNTVSHSKYYRYSAVNGSSLLYSLDGLRILYTVYDMRIANRGGEREVDGIVMREKVHAF